MIHYSRVCRDRTRLALYLALLLPCSLLLGWPRASLADGPATAPGVDRSPALAQLIRGNSTRADVERLLGRASGSGGSRLPPDWQIRDIWFYDSIKIGKITPEPMAPGTKLQTFHLDLSQDILIVFFAGDRYDGYLWYTNLGGTEGRVPGNLR